MLPKVVVTNRVHDEVLEFLGPHATLDANPDREPWGRDELLMRAHDATALITFMNDRVDDDFLGRCPDLGSAVMRARADIEMAAASVIQYLDGERPDGALNEPAAAEGHHPG